MSPTTILWLGAVPGVHATLMTVVGGGVPGVWDLVGGREGYTGTQPGHLTDPIFSHILAISPTHGQMKVN